MANEQPPSKERLAELIEDRQRFVTFLEVGDGDPDLADALNMARDMVAALKQLQSAHEPAPAPRFQVGQEVFAGCAVRKVLAISHCYKLSNTICEGSGWTMFDEHSVEPCSGTTKEGEHG